MLRCASDVIGFGIHASDGDIGRVRDLYFDEQQWALRHLVVDTGHWLPGRQVLVSRRAVSGVRWRRRRLETVLTRAQVRNSPARDADRPVSRQHEVRLEEYWYLVTPWVEPELEAHPAHEGDPHLRSLRRIATYTARAVDGECGHVADLLIDDGSWKIRYVVIDPRRWLATRHVLLPVAAVAWISWVEKAVHLDVWTDGLRNAPAWDPAHRLSASDEARVLAHYSALVKRRGNGDQSS